MNLIPNSFGAVREYNRCHNPAGSAGGGKFCSAMGKTTIQDQMDMLYSTPEGGRWSTAINRYVQTTQKNRAVWRQRILRELKSNPTARKLVALEQELLRRRFGNTITLYRGVYVKNAGKWDGGFPPVSSWSTEKRAAAAFGINEKFGGLLVQVKVPVDRIISHHLTNPDDPFEFRQKEVLVYNMPRLKKTDKFAAWELGFKQQAHNDYNVMTDSETHRRVRIGRAQSPKYTIGQRTEGFYVPQDVARYALW